MQMPWLICVKSTASPTVFRELTVRYSVDAHGRRFVVTVEDHQGRRVADEYVGIASRRIRILDGLGRVRRKRGSVLVRRRPFAPPPLPPPPPSTYPTHFSPPPPPPLSPPPHSPPPPPLPHPTPPLSVGITYRFTTDPSMQRIAVRKPS